RRWQAREPIAFRSAAAGRARRGDQRGRRRGQDRDARRGRRSVPRQADRVARSFLHAGKADMIKKKILIVDDSPLILEMARDALEDSGYQVFIAGNLEELETQRANAP